MHMNRNEITKDALSTVIRTDDELQQFSIVNDTYKEYPRNSCVPELVAMQAKATPDSIALVAEEQTLSYGELNSRANQIAHMLQALGVHAGTLVAICVERSPELVVGLLGILKAGGAYVPLDPTYPSDRLSFMLKDAQPLVLITQQHIATHLPIEETHVICLDSDAMLLSQQSESDPVPSSASTDLAYVIYTSGSTGQPKGAQVTHSNLLNLVFWHQHAFSVTASDRATQGTSPAFDATGWEIWPYLTAGASVYFIEQETRVAPALLRDWLVSHHITITFLPTALAESVMALTWPSTTSLRFLLTGADTLHQYPSPTLPFALINNYGLTETTVVSTFGQVHSTEYAALLPSIGRPIANTQIYILDEQLRPVLIGVPGELCIGGAGVGRGYLNRPDLTAQKFISDPFSNKSDTLLYKTGDMARIRPDGQVEFMGRIDQQIKIRGYRIEPDEIVSVLNEQQSIVTSLVIAREDTPGDKHLVAYIVLHPEAEITADALRAALAASLPDYMIPAIFVCLLALPITPNGKIDRAALPVPQTTNMLRESNFTAPGTPIEEHVATIVSTLLDRQQISVDDNFFLLGGHSLLGTQVIIRLQEAFGVEIPLRTIFNAPTVRLLSAEIEQLLLAKLESMSDEEALSLL